MIKGHQIHSCVIVYSDRYALTVANFVSCLASYILFTTSDIPFALYFRRQ